MKSSFLKDSTGKESHSRLLVMVCVPLLVLVPLAIWAHMSWTSKIPLGIDATIPLYIGTANGIILGYAAHSKYREGKPAAAPTP